MRTREPNDNTCGAHDDECTNWCERCQEWECDQCHSTCQEEYEKAFNAMLKKLLKK